MGNWLTFILVSYCPDEFSVVQWSGVALERRPKSNRALGDWTMDDKKLSKTEDASEKAWLQYLQKMAALDERAHQNYTECLARMQPDADSNKASLQARYRALRGPNHD